MNKNHTKGDTQTKSAYETAASKAKVSRLWGSFLLSVSAFDGLTAVTDTIANHEVPMTASSALNVPLAALLFGVGIYDMSQARSHDGVATAMMHSEGLPSSNSETVTSAPAIVNTEVL
jgi:hypothetical protein